MTLGVLKPIFYLYLCRNQLKFSEELRKVQEVKIMPSHKKTLASHLKYECLNSIDVIAR